MIDSGLQEEQYGNGQGKRDEVDCLQEEPDDEHGQGKRDEGKQINNK
jgi:hypothetical protein